MDETVEKLVKILLKYRDDAIKKASEIEELRGFLKQLIDIIVMDVEQLRDDILNLARRIDEIEKSIQ